MSKRIKWFSLGFAIVIGLVIGGFWFFFNSIDEKIYVDYEYKKINLPSSFIQTKKEWDDVHSYDPLLKSEFEYTYQIKGDSNSVANRKLQSALKSQGYTVYDYTQLSDIKDSFGFTANNNKIRLNVSIGTSYDTQGRPTSGHVVYLDAEKFE